MTEQKIYTTTKLGAVLLYLLIISVILQVLGIITGITGLTVGGLAIFGAVFIVSIITPDEK